MISEFKNEMFYQLEIDRKSVHRARMLKSNTHASNKSACVC